MKLLNPWVLIGLALALALAYGGGRFRQHRNDAAAFDAERTATALADSQARNKAVNEARVEDLVTFLFMAPSSQELEPPQNPGRFRSPSLDFLPRLPM